MIMRLYVFAIVIATFTSQAQTNRYFPPDFDSSYYGKALAVMKEPSVFEQSKESTIEIYRFLWLRSFHASVVVYIERRSSEAVLRVSQFALVEGVPKKLISEKKMTLDPIKWSLLSNKIVWSGVWKMPMEEKRERGTDGAHWIFEAASHGRYKVVDRWSPLDYEDLKDYVALCLHFLELAGIDTSKETLY